MDQSLARGRGHVLDGRDDVLKDSARAVVDVGLIVTGLPEHELDAIAETLSPGAELVDPETAATPLDAADL